MKKICIALFFLIILSQSLLSAQEDIIILPDITTYIDSTVEQRQVFTAEDIADSNAESLNDFLESEGMQILTYGAYGLEAKPSIRGFTDETVRVFIDGVCVNNPQYGTTDFTSINIDDIEKIEIVRGGFSEKPGDEGAVGGTIYITTKKQSVQKSFTSDSSVKTFFNLNFPLDTFSQSLNYDTPLTDTSSLKLSLKGTFAENLFLFNN
jgi:outer membrane cobalamin receptor